MKKKNRYETTIIINGALEETAIAQLAEKTTEFLTRNGGEIENVDQWGRRRLAYPINKKHNGFYIQYSFKAPSEIVAQIERYCFLEESIIRQLTLAISERDMKKREETRVRIAAGIEEEETEREGRDNDDL